MRTSTERELISIISTDEKFEGKGEVCGVKDSHCALVWQLGVKIGHSGSESTDDTLHDI